MRSGSPYVLMTGSTALNDIGKFTLVDPPTWVDRLAVENSQLLLYTKQPGLSLSVR